LLVLIVAADFFRVLVFPQPHETDMPKMSDLRFILHLFVIWPAMFVIWQCPTSR
jgi:hypothetical protein